MPRRYASLEQVITALQTITVSTNPLDHTLQACNLLAHLELVDRQLLSEAQRVLKLNTKYIAASQREDGGSEDVGGLNAAELAIVKGIVARGEKEQKELFFASLLMRRIHMNELLRSDEPTEEVNAIRRAYFPKLHTSFAQLSSEEKFQYEAELYIQSMTSAQFNKWKTSKNIALMLVAREARGEAIEKPAVDINAELERVLRAANTILNDRDSLQAIFKPEAKGIKVEATPTPTFRATPTLSSDYDDPRSTPVPKITFIGKTRYIVTPPSRRATMSPGDFVKREQEGARGPRRSLPLGAETQPMKRSKLRE